ncbi:hypothetical protein [Nocardia sp. NPDC058705]|uniref:hypothetical protein n=1 Tax=Nocardia sp. NPDC058705 TaxID=3346609 RepID=UPI0036AD79AF
MSSLLAPDATLHSPVKFTPFESRDQLMAVLAAVLGAIENFRYVGELHGAAEFSDRDSTGEIHALLFSGRPGRQADQWDRSPDHAARRAAFARWRALTPAAVAKSRC